MDNTVISKQLDYQIKVASEPQYSYTKIFPEAGTTSSTLTQSGGGEVVFQLPAVKCFNLARSWFQFNVQFTNANVTNAMYAWVFADLIPYFQSVQVYTRSGLQLLTLNQANLFSRMVLKPNKKLTDLFCGYNSAPSTDTQRYIPCYSDNTGANNITVRYDVTPATKANMEPTYLLRGAQTAAKNDPSLLGQVQIQFKDFPETILALDKDIMMNETLLIRFVWAPISNIVFLGSDAANPTTGAVANTSTTQAVTNMEIHLAVEKNLDIINSIQAKISSPEGMSVLIDYPNNVATTLSGLNQPVSLRINRSYGLTLKRIYHSVFNNTRATANTGPYMNDNRAGIQISEFYTMLNNTRLQDFNYVTASYDDYMAIKYLLDGSVISSGDVYGYNWCWIENFEQGNLTVLDDQSVIRGIDLNLGEFKYDFIGTAGGVSGDTRTHIDYVITKRKLVVAPTGIALN